MRKTKNLVLKKQKFATQIRYDTVYTMKIIKQSELCAVVKPYLTADPTIIEIGAFTGHDTIRMAEAFPTGTIYAFEPVPELYTALKEKTAIYTNIKTYPYAVSNADGTTELYLAQKNSGKITQASSLQKPKERLKHSPIVFPTKITVSTTTLVTWCYEQNIPTIDLLWLDTQGHEMTILKASQPILPHIRTIYTEVGFTEAYEGQAEASLVVKWLANAGFTPIAQDFTNPPTWFFGNILFVRNNLLR